MVEPLHQRNTQRGHIVPLLVVAAVLVVAGAVGFRLLNHSTDKSDQQTATNPSAQPNKEPADPSEGGKYLVIKEWGVRFALPKDLQTKIYYTPSQNEPDTMVIDSKDFATGAECPSFSLARTISPVHNSVDPYGFDSSSVAHIKDYYYSRITGVIACSNDPAVSQHASDTQRQLYDAAATIEQTK